MDKRKSAFHGGGSFSLIGKDFQNLNRCKTVVNVDVLDSWFDPSPNVTKKLKKFLNFALKSSPPTHSEGLIDQISKSRGIRRENILVGGGSSDIIFLFLPHLIGRKKKVLILDPMYGEYKFFLSSMLEANICAHLLQKKTNLKVNITLLGDQIKKERPDAVILVNPNSPTGQHIDSKNLISLVKRIPSSTRVIIDETYMEYIGKKYSLEKQATKLKNLVIIKSMSKTYALSGARVGYLVAHRTLIDDLYKWSPPWAVSLPGQIAAVEALRDERYYRKKYLATHKLRNEMAKKLENLDGKIKVYKGKANFLLVELRKGSVSCILRKLRDKKIFVRNCDSMSYRFKDNFIRITIKDRKTNNLVVEELEKALRC